MLRKSSAMLASIAARSLCTMAASQASAWRRSSATTASGAAGDGAGDAATCGAASAPRRTRTPARWVLGRMGGSYRSAGGGQHVVVQDPHRRAEVLIVVV